MLIDDVRSARSLVLRAAGFVLIAVLLKLVVHRFGWEFLSLNPLFSGIVAANVFLMGFLLSGVLNDYRESERLPGEIAASLELFVDEARTIHERSKAPVALEFAGFIEDLALHIRGWFHKTVRTAAVMEKTTELNRYFLAFEPLTAANHVVRLKQEQHALRKLLIRVHTIRETSFISSGYLIAELTTFLLGLGLIFVRIDPFYESLFFVGVIVFLLTYLIFLIRDLDNPFGYYDAAPGEDVSLKPLDDCISRICAYARSADQRMNEAADAPPALRDDGRSEAPARVRG